MAEPLAELDAIVPVAHRRSLVAGRGALIVGGGLFGVIVLLCLLAPVIAPHPNRISFDVPTLSGPTDGHPLGTDSTGRDILSRVLYGGQLDIFIGVVGALISFLVGGTFGLILGYARGRGSELVMRMLDVIQAFPLLIFSLVLLAFLGQSTWTIVGAVAFVNVPIFMRLIRSETLAVSEAPFVEAARAVGNSTRRVVFRHVLPNVLTSSLTQLTTTTGFAILLTGALSFLGVGVRPPKAEWGSMIYEGQQYLVTGQWWQSIFPGIALFLTVLALHTLGEGFVRLRQVR